MAPLRLVMYALMMLRVMDFHRAGINMTVPTRRMHMQVLVIQKPCLYLLWLNESAPYRFL